MPANSTAPSRTGYLARMARLLGLRPSPLERPVFLVGCSKSGTTMLGLILSCHPDLGPANPFLSRFGNLQAMLDAVLEDKVFDPIAHELEHKQLWDTFFPANHVPLRTGSELALTTNPLTPKRTRELCRALAALCPTGRLFCKGPFLSFRIHVLRELFPKARIVAIHRDGRDVVSSWGRKQKRWETMGGFGAAIEVLARKWNETIDHVEDARRELDLLTLRYEDFIAEPDATLQTICKYCALNYDGDLFGGLSLRQSVGLWRERIPAEHHRQLQDSTRRNRLRLGYAD